MFKVSQWHELKDDTQFRACRDGYILIGRVWPRDSGYFAVWGIKDSSGYTVASDTSGSIVGIDRQSTIKAMCVAADAAFETLRKGAPD